MADAGRVIAGSAAGRRLLAPTGGTRPLADRVKQALFGILEPDLPGASFLDLFAGSGAAGIEALSRGAERVVFVERDPGAVRTLQENLRRTGLAGAAAHVVRADALGWLGGDGRREAPFAVAFVDPPYDRADLLLAALERIGPLLGADARAVAKYFWREEPPARLGLLASERQRRFGETALTFYRRVAADTDEEEAVG